VTIPGSATNLNFVRVVVTEAQNGHVLGLDELLILNAFWQERSIETLDAAHLTQKPESAARATLRRLVEAGLVDERGQKKGRTRHLSAAAYRAFGDSAAYVRQRG
jgi:ATP-dependent DNA helicase RecG